MMLIVCDTAAGLYQAGVVAANLFSTKAIQGWELSADTPGLSLNLYPTGSGVVSDRGGLTAYKAWILAQFTAYGYKEDTADESTDTTVTDVTPPLPQPLEEEN